jgi:hypothetical protein
MRAANGSFQRRLKHTLEAAAAFAAVFFFLVSTHAQSADPSGASPQIQSDAASVPEPTLKSGVLPARLSDVEGAVHITGAPPANAPSQTDSAASQPPPGQVPPPPPDQLPSEATLNMPVLAGSGMETGSDGRAEWQFDDGSIVRIAPSSDALLGSLSASGEQISALDGLTYYETPAQPAGVLAIRVRTYTIKPGADSLVRVDMDTSPNAIAVLRGTAELDTDGAGVPLQAGQTVTLDGESPAGYSVSAAIASISWDAWNSDRDAQLSAMASGETNARDGSTNADAGAWDDLDYYGTWYDVPGVGEAWAPDGVNADFDPYGAGAWGYYTGVGYTWVSAYPWGWLPYHCGIWSHYNQFGWLWQPGACGTYDGGGWFPYTAVFNPPHGYRLPRYRTIHPFDPRLRTHLGGVPLPPLQAYQSVSRGPQFKFRALGGARSEPRPLPVQNKTSSDGGTVYASVLPVIPILPGEYRNGPLPGGGGDTGGGARSGFVEGAQGSGTGIQNQHVRAVYIPRTTGVTPQPNGHAWVAPSGQSSPRAYEPSHAAPGQRQEAPRQQAPASHYEAPAEHYSAPSSHASSPAPSSSSHGH